MKIVTFLLLLCTGSAALASLADDAQRKREVLEIYAYRVTSEVCLITRNGGDRAASERLQNIMTEAAALSRDIAGIWPGINREWQKTEEFIAAHKEGAESGDIVNIVPKLLLRQESLYSAFDEDRPAAVAAGSDEQSIIVMLGSLEKMLASYLMFQTSMFGGHGFAEVSIETESKHFDDALASLQDETLKSTLTGKWEFVKGALLAYNEKSAVFIVERTGRSIRDLLLSHITLLPAATE